MHEYEFHLLANAHLDPVWLWGWQEGLNEALTTTRTMLDLMDEDKEFTFMRGEAVLYEHIERCDPETFVRVKRYVKEGRWDIVGGTYLQSDMNMPGTETFARHFCLAQDYFMSRFNKRVKVAWAADAFGHSAGLPSIMAAAGIEGFSFTRPYSHQYAMPKPLFWWEGPDGARVLAYRPINMAYCCARHSVTGILDGALKNARNGDLRTVGVFYGLGNHGGGSTRRMLKEIRLWAKAHPEVRVIHSGLHGFFNALRKEAAGKEDGFVPVHRGEINFVFRGCYSSTAGFKRKYRQGEALAARSEKMNSAITAALPRYSGMGGLTRRVWKDVLFNSFHDILPGSSIERAYDEQFDWLGGALHDTRRIELDSINALAADMDTTVMKVKGDHPSAVAFVAFNPHPQAYHGPVEFEAALDYRPINKYFGKVNELPMEFRGPDKKPLPFQAIEVESNAFPAVSWRYRVVANVDLPPMGWSVFSLGWVEAPKTVASRGKPALSKGQTGISNGHYEVTARKGSAGVRFVHKGKRLLDAPGLSAVTVKDVYGSWGHEGIEENPSLTDVLYRWRVTDVHVVESGPERAVLWVRIEGGHSFMELFFSLARGSDRVDVTGRLLWNEKLARLKLLMPLKGRTVEYSVPGGSVTRKEAGEVPGGRWARVHGKMGCTGFMSDAFYSYDLNDGVFSATVTRSAHYGKTSSMADPNNGIWVPGPWKPVMDQGMLRFRFALVPGNIDLENSADEFEQPPVVVNVPPKKGGLSRSGTLLEGMPPNLRLLALKRAENGRGWIMRLQETSGKPVSVKFKWLGRVLRVGDVAPRQIATFRLCSIKEKWKSERVDIREKA